MSARGRRVRVGVDIGGTFTDLVVLGPAGELHTKKVSSTTGDYSRAIIDGLRALAAETGLAPDEIAELLHGTTVATNAILQHQGALTGLVTTRGFRDVLEFARMRRPVLYDLRWQKPVPLVERSLRLEVDERLGADGTTVRPVRPEDVRAVARRLRTAGVESVAISLLHAYRDPTHERQVAAVLREELPGVPLSLSSEVLPEIDEYERTSTTVINAYIKPTVESYVQELLARLTAGGVAAPVLLMQSGGGVMPARTAAEQPIHIVESGPAAGVIGSAFLARSLGLENAITFDMGGTTAKASIVEDGRINLAHEYEVGAGISIGTRLQSGGGYAIRTAAIDLAEVGAGGGSVVWIDRGGALQVGPRSAGAVPGPVCYGAGGEAPTITDANLALGYLNPAGIAGGTVRLDVAAARQALEREVAGPLGLVPQEACYGVYLVANSNMIRAIRAVTTERGRDPRQFTLIAFGGSGPVHAAEMARSLGIRRVVVPPVPGLFSALGLLFADVERRAVRAALRQVSEGSVPELEAAYRELETEASEALGQDGYALSGLSRSADLRYVGQSESLLVELPNTLGEGGAEQIAAAFDAEHERRYGHRWERAPIELVNLRVTARAATARPTLRGSNGHQAPGPVGEAGRRRTAYFGPYGELETPILGHRAELGAEPRRGPLIVEEYDATIVVPPGCSARLDETGNVVIAIEEGL